MLAIGRPFDTNWLQPVAVYQSATVFDDSSSTTVMCHQAYAGPEPAWLGVGERRMCLGNLHDRSGGHAESLIDVANVQISLQACIGLLANIPDGFQLEGIANDNGSLCVGEACGSEFGRGLP